MLIKPGDILAECYPFVHSIDHDRSEIFCNYCFRASSSLKKCSQCHIMRYCSSRCQVKDWRNVHSVECNYYLNDSLSDEPVLYQKTWHRLVFRALLIVIKHPKRANRQIDTFFGPRSFLSLLNHNDKMLTNSNEKSRWAFQMACDFERLGVPMTKKVFCDIFGKLIINSFAIFDNIGARIGSGVYVATSVYNHSCYPNSTYIFDGLRMQVRAVKEFDSEKEPPTICYLDWKMSREERQARLCRQYYFVCDCYLCGHPSLDRDRELECLQDQFIEYMKEDNLRSAFDWGCKIVEKSRKQYPYPFPALTLILFKLIQIGIMIGDDRTMKIESIFRETYPITHGYDHSITEEFAKFGL
ncbi:histone-lysine N-methyltransferase SMYD3-like [Brevipalpus obovatus]|uniref:histone-lysine N-methyltransferase SMYD3-like n=1 Tax=Brevipalpus obovatus TaxID=246614 RepID=UPI003D9E03E2